MSAAGWVLSIFGQLNRTGYAVALGCSAVILFFAVGREPLRRLCLRRLQCRFRRPFPLAFLALAFLALVGGCLYPPSNFDALSCRTARVLHWLDAGQWHWIAADVRGALNTRTCAFEWMTAPILLFFHSDRWLFLFNGFSFLLLPGLVFSVFRRLGLSGRVAWHWMWLLPAGLCFALQAGSLGNDIFGAALALAAIDFALRARPGERSAADSQSASPSPKPTERGCLSRSSPANEEVVSPGHGIGTAGAERVVAIGWKSASLRYSVLAAALMTGAKFSNLTLLLPWGIAILPALRNYLRWRKPAETSRLPRPAWFRELALTAGALILALFASFVPTSVANYRHTHDWTGMAAEDSWLSPPNGLVCFAHNVGLLTVQHLAPPVFPFASAWDRFLLRHIPECWKATLDRFAEDGRNSYRVRELPMEEHAGLGLGLTLVVAAQLLVALFRRRENSTPEPKTTSVIPGNGTPASVPPARPWLGSPGPSGEEWHPSSLEWPWETLWRAALLVSPFISLGVFMSKSAMVAVSRLVSPDYALLLPLPLVLSKAACAARARWWHGLAALAFAFAFIAVILTPARPLFPAARLFHWLQARHPSPAVERAALAYSVYRERWDVFAPLREVIPPSAKVLGAATGWGPETCLWRPLGQRRLVNVRGNTSLEEARRLGIEYVVVQPDGAPGLLGAPFPEWLRKMNAVELRR